MSEKIIPLFEPKWTAQDVLNKLQEAIVPETKLIVLYQNEEGNMGWGTANMNNMEMNWLLDIAKDSLMRGE